MLDQLAGLVDRGKLEVEVNLQPGMARLTPQWMIRTLGSPKAALVIEANQGRVQCVDIDVTGGTLLISGQGLRPSLSIEGMQFEEGAGIVDARFRGRGVWRPIIAVFRTLARPALRRLDVPTDIRSILMGEIDRHVPLNFDGTFDAHLHFDDAGGDEGSVMGNYRFTIAWPPVEQAAFEVLRARWRQDIAPAIQRVDFAIEPRHFGPCGRDCFLLDLKVTAQKPKAKGYWFQQICDTEGKADVVVDSPSRTLLLRNVRVAPHCQGAAGAVVNFVAPFLTKSHSDVELLQMPKELPFTIESVGSSAESIVIAGKIAWGETASMASGSRR